MSQKVKTAKRKTSSVRHTRAIQRARSQHPLVTPPPEQITARLTELILPATEAQQASAHQTFGLRLRDLTPVVMMALILSLIWRQVGNLSAGVRLLNSEGLLWASAMAVTQQAVSLRFGSLSAELFLRVLAAVLPLCQARWQARDRPLPPELAWAHAHYTRGLACDGSPLDALVRKIGLLHGLAAHPLAGRMTALLDLCSRLPQQVWYEPAPQAHDQRAWPQIVNALLPGTLLMVDLGYTNFVIFAQLTQASVKFITRAKTNLTYDLDRVVRRSANVHDLIIGVGRGDQRQRLRLVEVLYHGLWYRYLTNELDTNQLPTAYVVALYWQRWRIEEAYAIVKRLLGLAYFLTGAENGVCLQLWATWLLYVVLVDLTDAVADALKKPFAAISIEMVYRSLYFFGQAVQRGEATDVIAYLTANAAWLGVLKRKSKRLSLELLLPLTKSADP